MDLPLPFNDDHTPDVGSIRIGPAGWSYPDWKGIVFPLQTHRGFDPLTYLSQYFDTVEVNSTFYRPAPPKIYENWANRVSDNPRFKFTVKLWNRFTHERTPFLASDAPAVRSGLDVLAKEGRLGCMLIQFPWSFKNCEENRRYIALLAEIFHPFPIVLEIRHASWNQEAFYGFLKGLGVGLVNLDQPLFKNSFPPMARTTSPIGYIRLHGLNYKDWFREDAGRDARYNYLYNIEELKEWADRTLSLLPHTSEIYVITNNHYQGQAVCNAFQLKWIFRKKPISLPDSLVSHYPHLKVILGYNETSNETS